jgi:hypothetical protein
VQLSKTDSTSRGGDQDCCGTHGMTKKEACATAWYRQAVSI